MKKTIISLITCFVTSCTLLIVLFITTGIINHSKNGFVRLIPPHSLIYEKTVDLKYGGFYLCGTSSNNLYFANYLTPSRILSFGRDFSNKKLITIKNPTQKKLAWQAVLVKVDSPDVYIIDRITATIIHSQLGTSIGNECKLDSFQFTTAVPLSPYSVVFRRFNKAISTNTLIKEDVNTINKHRTEFILKKQKDGFFCTDGILLYNVDANTLVYIYYYRNEFICLDTNLNVTASGHTIDTNSIAKIEVSFVPSEKAYKMSAPPLVINRKAYSSGSWLFVNSTLTADNEDKSKVKNNVSTIDIYSIKTGEYRFSFYLPANGNKKLSNFYVIDKMLIAQYDNITVIYKLNLPI